MFSKSNQSRIGFILKWILVNAFCWPIGLLSGIILGLAWIRLWANLIPGRLELGYSLFIPNHEHIQVFIWSAMIIGGAITGLVVGVSQYRLLHKHYGVSSTWILISVLGWSLAGLSVKAIDTLSSLNPINDRLAYTLLVTIPFGVGSGVTGLWLGKRNINHQKRMLFSFIYCLTIMLGAAFGWLLGPFPLSTASPKLPMEIIGFVGLGILIGGFSALTFIIDID